jgi:hypothetical protein
LGRLEGDMGLEPDGLPSPHPRNQPPQRSARDHLPPDCLREVG